MLGGPELLVDAGAGGLARGVLRPPVRRVPPPAFRTVEAVTAGLLPEYLRLAYGLRWGPAERLGFGAMRRGLPLALRVLPSRFRQVPPAPPAPRGPPGARPQSQPALCPPAPPPPRPPPP